MGPRSRKSSSTEPENSGQAFQDDIDDLYGDPQDDEAEDNKNETEREDKDQED